MKIICAIKEGKFYFYSIKEIPLMLQVLEIHLILSAFKGPENNIVFINLHQEKL